MKTSLINDNKINDNKSGYLSEVDMVVDFDNLNELSELCINFHLCPCTFTENKRNTVSFQSTDILYYDFDGNIKSLDIHTTMNRLGYNHLIVGSKNHLKDKGDGKGIMERFHLFVPLDNPITDRFLLKYSLSKTNMLWDLGADKACFDVCRYFFKHSTLLFIQNKRNNVKISWINQLRNIDNEREKRFVESQKVHLNKINNSSPMNLFKKTKGWKMLTQEMSSDGNRYSTGNKIIGIMKLCGLNLSEALNLFDQYSVYGESHNPQTIETRWHKY